MAVWVYIALAIFALFLTFLYLVKFHFSLDLKTPETLQASVGLSFLWMRRELVLNAAQALSSRAEEAREPSEAPPAGRDSHTADPLGAPDPDQRGAVRIPDSWIGSAARFRLRVK